MRLFRMDRPVMEFPETPFLNFWPGEVVRHMGHPKGESFLAGCIVDADRHSVTIQWETALDKPERITNPAALAQIVKQPMPAFAQL